MSVLPSWPPKTPTEAAMYAVLVSAVSGFVSVIALGMNAWTFWLAERRRRERITIRVNFRERFDREQLELLAPGILAHYPDIQTGDRGLYVAVRYRGPHSTELTSIICQRAFLPPLTLPGVARATLLNDQRYAHVLPPVDARLDDIIGIIVETRQHGRRLKRVHHWRRLERYIFHRWPAAYTFYNKWIRVRFEKDLEIRRVVERAIDPQAKDDDERPHPPH